MIRNILLDMGGVVTLQDADEARRRFADLGIDSGKLVHSYGQTGVFGAFEAGEIDEEDFCAELSRMAGREISLQEAAHCCLGFKKEAPIDRLHYLLELKQKYHLCLVSNTNPFVINDHCTSNFSSDGRPISDYFHSLLLSYKLKVCKPDKEFFIRALAADNMKAEECVFIDDSLTNIQSAEALGIHGIHINTNEPWREKLEKILSSENHA
ncbi:MAG: HAD family phosphatase [Bacteroidaceae bacterium]|nr:HAD family phosphatase [Bacteroidaceae bacterium]